MTADDPLRGEPPTLRPTWLPGPEPIHVPPPKDAWSDDPDRTTRRA